MVHSSAGDYEKKLDFYRQRPDNPAGQMRANLQLAEGDCLDLHQKESQFIVDYLTNLDNIQAALAELGRPGRLNVTPEKIRFQVVQRQFFKHAPAILRRLGGAEALHQFRPEDALEELQPWWFLDDYLARRRSNLLKSAGQGLVILALLTVLAVIAFNLFIRPDRNIEAHTDLYFEAYNSVTREEDFEAALVAIDEALLNVPDDAETWVFKGIILDELDRPEEADEAFHQAQALVEKPEQIAYLRSRLQLELAQPARAALLAQEAIDLNPEYAEAWLMLGLAYEDLHRLDRALAAMEKAADLADAQENGALKVMIRVNMSNLAGQQ